ncbi:hypothetical protein [Jiangella endophytica]|uniref:hypothetical protein n=1 Tax=Jiangella endophytica TaxID=1623398 RepID=UPI0013009C47|nr:hypothetical protein [Jiangella endophytica]
MTMSAQTLSTSPTRPRRAGGAGRAGRSRPLLLAALDPRVDRRAGPSHRAHRRRPLPASRRLRAAGLVTSHRTDRVVLYARPALGDALLGG